MRRIPTAVGLSLLPLLVVTGVSPPVSSADPASAPKQTAVSRPAATAVLEAAPGAAHTFVRPAAPRSARTAARTATFQVSYTGFNRRARRAFQRAVNLWAPRVTSSVPITVDATFEPASPGNLGSAGPSFIWRDFSGAPKRGTWYVDAIANKRSGTQLDPAPDIVANFNSNRSDWYFGRDGNPPAGRYDFTTVVMHELGHGLGFLGLGFVDGNGRGTVRIAGDPSGYDRLTENRTGRKLLGFPDGSNQLGNQLTGNRVYFDSRKVRNANNNRRARLYAPATWNQGSSYSHLNEATYRPGNRNSLMTPFLSSAEAIHNPGPIVNAVFRSTGW